MSHAIKQDWQPQAAPFISNILGQQKRCREVYANGDEKAKTGDGDDGTELQDQFPASYRVPNDDLRAPVTPELDLIAKELDLKRLQKIIHLLWLSGRPVPPRPLHYQLALGRHITITERMEVHLVWGSGRIFLKPIPRYLLNPRFWETHLWCDRCRGHDFPATPTSIVGQTCEHKGLRAVALGFLLSYVALIAYESDFAIAKDRHLIPAEITWPRWRHFVREMLACGSAVQLYKSVAPRFVYGELRLNRLNLIFFALEGPLSSGFVPTWNTFGSFFRDNSAWVITVTAYVILVLSAMEVGLSTDKLDNSEAFQAASYGFTVFSLFVPIFTVGVLVFLSIILWAYNIHRTRLYEAKRVKHLERDYRREGSSMNKTLTSVGSFGYSNP